MSLWSRHYTTEHNKVKYTRTDCVTVLKTYVCRIIKRFLLKNGGAEFNTQNHENIFNQ